MRRLRDGTLVATTGTRPVLRGDLPERVRKEEWSGPGRVASTEWPDGACILPGCRRKAIYRDVICRECSTLYRRGPAGEDRCECGTKLVGVYALERGTCFKCFEEQEEAR